MNLRNYFAVVNYLNQPIENYKNKAKTDSSYPESSILNLIVVSLFNQLPYSQKYSLNDLRFIYLSSIP